MPSEIATFGFVFGVIFLLELVDRTNFAVIGLAARQATWPTWAGAAVAFLATSGIAVAIGTLFLTVLKGDLVFLKLGGGAFILGYAGYLSLVPPEARAPPSGRSAFASAFLLIFLLELGDSTMILIVLFAGTTGAPLLVFAAGASALLAVASIGSNLGRRLGARVEPKVLDRLVIGILVVVGLITIVAALEPGWIPSLLV
ncbi:MAG TPA: TMEM165/GDT1 family protein [Thermoplasmata archaeon]|nr:TMEM165/GDT1 family protein [Thermoplasmata archaeon]